MAEVFTLKKKRNPVPTYFRVQLTLQKAIEDGTWAVGECLPTEKQLAEEHKVSIGTVKKAVLNLVSEGYLYRIAGKGTFVAGTILRRESLRYYRLMGSFKEDHVDLKVKLLEVTEKPGNPGINSYLHIAPNAPLYEIKRFFLLNDAPLVYTVSYLPQEMFPGLESCPPSWFEKTTLYEAIENKYGVTTVFNQKLIGAVSADKQTADCLGIDPGHPILSIEMLSFTYKETPYEYRQSFCQTDNYRLFVEI